MAEQINKVILITEYKTEGAELSIQKVNELKTATDKLSGATLAKVEADKKVEQAASQAGVAIDTETKKVNELTKAIEGTANTMSKIGQANTLKDAFAKGGTAVESLDQKLKKFQETARNSKSVEELNKAVSDLLDSIDDPQVKAELFKIIDKEANRLEKVLGNPVARLRELKRLIATEEDPKAIRALQLEAAKLQDELQDNADLLKALSSDTFFTDTLIEGVQTSIGAFTAFQGILSLTTEDEERFAEATAKAQGALALLQGVQTLVSNLKKEDSVITRSQTAIQKVYTAVVGTSTGATKAFRIALLASGIGLAVVALGFLVSKFLEYNREVKKNSEATERNIRIRQKTIEGVAKEQAAIEVARVKLLDANTTTEERTEIIKDLQAQYPGYLKNISAEKSSYQEISDALDQVNRALFLKFEIQAREEELTELFKRRNAEQDAYNDAIQKESDLLKQIEKDRITSQDPNEFRTQDLGIIAPETALAGALKIDLDKTDVEIKNFINELLKKQEQLSELGGDFSKTAVKATDSLVEGSLKDLQLRVQKLREVAVESLKFGTDAQQKATQDYILAQIDLNEKLKSLDLPEVNELEVLTEGSRKALQKQISDLNKIIDDLPEGDELVKASEQLRQAQAQLDSINKIIAGNQVEEVEDQNLAIFDEQTRHEAAMLQLRGESELAQLQLARNAAVERLAIIEATDKDNIEAINAQRNAIIELDEQIAQSAKKTQQERIQILVEGTGQLVNAAIDAAEAFIQIEQNKNDRLIELQKDRVAEAEKIADKGNVALLEAEQERLDELNKKREKFVIRQQQLAQAQLVVESILAIAKAAAQGGAAAPFTIAATLIALATGIAQARAQAQSALSFRKGGVFDSGYTGDGPPDGQSLALGNKPYEYHYREHIMPHEVTRIGNNISWLEKIRTNKIDIEQLVKRGNGGSAPVIVEAGNHVTFKSYLNSKGIIRIVEESEKTKRKIESRR